MATKPKNDRCAAIIGEATGKISTIMVDAIRKLDSDNGEIIRMLRHQRSIVCTELEHQELTARECVQD